MEESDHEQLRLTAAREAFKKHRAGSAPVNFPTWPEWWESRYGNGETFDEYVRRKRREQQT